MQLSSSATEFTDYLKALETKWLRIVLFLGSGLVLVFGLLDYFMVPREKLPFFLGIRAAVVVICLFQLLRFRKKEVISNPTLHAYFFSFTVCGMISIMTTQLGGFESSYYVGLILILIGVNLFLPWDAKKCIWNGLVIILQYLILNLLLVSTHDFKFLLNNLYFILAAFFISIVSGYYKYILTKSEFELRNALWGEMEIASKLQTALLPEIKSISNYDIASKMIPAEEVGGDYFDIICFPDENVDWIVIGDVAGHGVTSGLIMMMLQTSIFTAVNREPHISPDNLLLQANRILKENISRLGEAKYATIVALRFQKDRIVFAGKHQDIFVYRSEEKRVETVKTNGFWIGLKDDLRDAFDIGEFRMKDGDVILLHTDGVTELMNEKEEMFGQERLVESFQNSITANSDIEISLELILADIKKFSAEFDDDLTLLLVRKK